MILMTPTFRQGDRSHHTFHRVQVLQCSSQRLIRINSFNTEEGQTEQVVLKTNKMIIPPVQLIPF